METVIGLIFLCAAIIFAALFAFVVLSGIASQAEDVKWKP